MKWHDTCLGEDYLPLWLQEEGYATYLTGKFLNRFGPNEPDCPKVGSGWCRFFNGSWLVVAAQLSTWPACVLRATTCGCVQAVLSWRQRGSSEQNCLGAACAPIAAGEEPWEPLCA